MPKTTILIIGAGNAGESIASNLITGQFNALVCDKDPVKAAGRVKKFKGKNKGCDREAMQCSFESAWEADVIILAINFEEQIKLASTIREVINQKILVSMMQPFAGVSLVTSLTDIQCAELQELLPNTKIVYIVNDISIDSLPVVNNINNGIMIIGTDANAVEVVSCIPGSTDKLIRPQQRSTGAGIDSLLHPNRNAARQAY